MAHTIDVSRGADAPPVLPSVHCRENSGRHLITLSVPSVVFTLPRIATVGLSEAAARAQQTNVRVSCAKVPGWCTARRVAETVYGYKTILAQGTGRILGARMVGPHADEVFNLLGLAIRHDLTADDFKSTICGYPTGASEVGNML